MIEINNNGAVYLNQYNIIIIDIGSYICKYGYAGYDKPLGTIKTINIVKNGVIHDFDKMNNIFNVIFYEKMKIDTHKTKIIISCQKISDNKYNDKIITLLLDTYKFHSVQILNQQLLSLYSVSRNNGIIVDIGHDITRIVPIYNSYIIDYAILYSHLAGKNINKYIAKKEGIKYDESNYSDNDKFNKIKKKNVFGEYNIHDVLLEPQQSGFDCEPLQNLIKTSLFRCPIDTRLLLSQNIILIGGSSTIPNLCKLLRKNMDLSFKFKICGPKNRHFASWIGGSVISCLPTFDSRWIRR